MLSLEEALLLKAAYEEKEKQDAQTAAGITGGIGGALLGRAGGGVTHQLGRGINALRPGHQVNPMKFGNRKAGTLAGAILGGALGAGTAAVMKQNNRPAQVMGEIQSKGGRIDPALEKELAQILSELYTERAGM